VTDAGSASADRGRPAAVVIPSWNCLEDLRDCLASVRAQDGADAEIMVVDNGSADGTGAFLEQEGIPHLALPQNAGFARAVNLGVAGTASPFLFVLNADTVLEPDCLAHLVASMPDDPAVGGVQPRILTLDRGGPRDRDDPAASIYSVGQGLTADGRGREEGRGLHQESVRLERREVFGLCGAACLLRRELFVELGGYDERYFSFYEDVDLNVRARIAGWRFLLEPEAVVWHVGEAAWRQGFARPTADNARLVARNRLATQVKFVPARTIPRIALVEVASFARAAAGRRVRLTLAGKFEALRWFPRLLRERRRLRQTGEPARATSWLGRSVVSRFSDALPSGRGRAHRG
jgi:GT2 family glycosyltransferase